VDARAQATKVIDRNRKLVFAGAAIMLLGITGLLALRGSSSSENRGPRPERRSGPAAIRAEPSLGSESDAIGNARSSPSPASPASSIPPVGATRAEGEARKAPAVAPREARAAASAARAFLEGYLPYSYGRADAERIRGAAIPLLRELAASPPRVPASVTRARPQLVSVRAEATTAGSDVDIVAVVEDGRRRYRIPLAVRNTGRRWVVTAVSG
jgi:hypothetical protein